MIEDAYTELALIRFIYNESPPSEARRLRNRIREDWEAKEEYDLLKEAQRNLPKVTFSPKKETLRRILGQSSASSLELC